MLPRDLRIPRGHEVTQKTSDWLLHDGFVSGFAGGLDSEIQTQHSKAVTM